MKGSVRALRRAVGVGVWSLLMLPALVTGADAGATAAAPYPVATFARDVIEAPGLTTLPRHVPAADPAPTSTSTAPAAATATVGLPAPRATSAAPAAVAPAPDPWSQPHANWIMIPAVGLSLPVSTYSDCNARTPVTHASAARDVCAPSATVYLLGHNPGQFSPLPGARTGDLVRYWDATGRPTTFRLTSVRAQTILDDGEMFNAGPAHIVLQTCANSTGSVVWMLVGYPVQ